MKLFLSLLSFFVLSPAHAELPPTVENTYEVIDEREPLFLQGLVDATVQGMKAKPEEGQEAKKSRDAHAKEHACIDNVSIEVEPHLDPHLEHGFFQRGAKYQGLVRLSAGAPTLNSNDLEGGAQGFALKILLPPDLGAQILPVLSEQYFVDEKYYKSFDIVTINRLHEFFVPTLADYPNFLKASGMIGALKAKTMAKIASLDAQKDAREIAALLEMLQTESGKIMGGYFIHKIADPQDQKRVASLLAEITAARPKNLFWETYLSEVPSLLGPQAVKYRISPCEQVEPEAYDLASTIGTENVGPNFFRAVLEHEAVLQAQCFHLSVQLHQEGMPSVEKASAPWVREGEDKKWEKVATITIPQRDPKAPFRTDGLCEKASFHPGHASKEHYPIGAIQRARVGYQDVPGIYTMISKIRNLNQGHTPLN